MKDNNDKRSTRNKSIVCPVCKAKTLKHDSWINCWHCTNPECLYQWHPSSDYSDSKRFITNLGLQKCKFTSRKRA